MWAPEERRRGASARGGLPAARRAEDDLFGDVFFFEATLVAFLAGAFDAAFDDDVFLVVFFADVFFADVFLAVVSAMTLLSQLLADHQSLDQLVLAGGRLLVTEVAGSPQVVDALELGPDRHRVVERALRLTLHLLGYRHHSSQRRRRKREQPGHQTHQPLPTKS
jgi:hypothetical protein